VLQLVHVETGERHFGQMLPSLQLQGALPTTTTTTTRTHATTATTCPPQS
jgi:hypothetical protein